MVVHACQPSTWQEETGAEGHLFKANLNHRIPRVRKQREAGKMSQWVRAFAAKPDNLIPSLYIYNGRMEPIPTRRTLTSTHTCTDANK